MAKKRRPKSVAKARQFGRWHDRDWEKLREAAALKRMPIASFFRPFLIELAEQTIHDHEEKQQRRRGRSEQRQRRPQERR